MDNTIKTHFTVDELTGIFDVTRGAIHQWKTGGRFPNHTFAGRIVIFPIADVNAVIDEEINSATKSLVDLREKIMRLERARS